MSIITQTYELRGSETRGLNTQRAALSSFAYHLDNAISSSLVFLGASRDLNYLPAEILYPEHNVLTNPILLADQLRNGISEESLRKEPNLRRIYQMGGAVLRVRCVPDFTKQLDELEFIFSGECRRDIGPAVKVVTGIVFDVNHLNMGALEWYCEDD